MSILLDGTLGITTPGLTNTGTETLVNLTTTGNTILGNASTDTLNVGNGDLIKDASGNVGIGVTPPSLNSNYKNLQIGNALIIDNSNSGADGHINFNAKYTPTGWQRINAGYASQISSGGNGMSFSTSTTSTANSAITWIDAMTLDASGNVGIGVTPFTNTISKSLDMVNGVGLFGYNAATYLSSNAYFDTSWKYKASGFGGARYSQDAGTHVWSTAPSGTAGNAITFTQAMTLDASGNLLVGTTSGGAKINASNTNNSTTAANYFWVNNATVNIQNLSTTADSLASLSFYMGAGNSVSAVAGVQESSALGALAFYTGGSGRSNTVPERMRISSAGIVTMSAYGAGSATFSAAGVISSVSDETWKTKDGVPLNPDAMLKKLEPGYWHYNEEKAPIFGAERQLGFYAQNVNYAIGIEAAPIPEEGKPWGYYDRSVLAVAVMSLQKALTTIESLTARLELLEAK